MTTVEEMSAKVLAVRNAMRIADKVVPKYRLNATRYSCTSTTAHLWQAAFDGAIEAMGYDNEQFKGCPPTFNGSVYD